MKTSKPSRRPVTVLWGTAPVALVVFAALAAPPALGATAKKQNIRENHYYYSGFNRPDPFRSLVSGKFVRIDKMSTVDVNSVELVGIVRGDMDRFALLEDAKGFNYILRVGDRVRGGTVVSIGDQSMVARVTNFGQTSRFTLHLVQRVEGVKR